MKSWSVFLLIYVTQFIVVHSQLIVNTGNKHDTKNGRGECGKDECQDLQNRVHTLESAMRSIVSAVLTQKDRQFAPIKDILKNDPALRTILVSATTQRPGSLRNISSSIDENNGISKLKGAIKCSMPQYLDIGHSEASASPFGKIKGTLGANYSLEVEWTPSSKDCFKYTSGIWIRVFESGQNPPKNLTEIPYKCLKRQSPTTFVIFLSPFSETAKENKTSCQFKLTEPLIQCRSYTIQATPNYQSLKSQLLTTEIVVPSMSVNSTNLESLISVSSRSKSLLLNWEDNSGCAAQLTSFTLEIFPDGKLDNEEGFSNSSLVKIPRSCLTQPTDANNLFSMVLLANLTCPIEWKPLDVCRKYKLRIQSEYSDSWASAPYELEIFTAQDSGVMVDLSRVKIKRDCPYDTFYCPGRNTNNNYRSDSSSMDCIAYRYACDEKQNCDNGIDELNCQDCNSGKFRCRSSRQCVDRNKLCDGNIDCLDTSDEHDKCGYIKNPTCFQMTSPFGQIFNEEKGYGVIKKVKRSAIYTVLITVPKEKVIWLTFTKYNTYSALRVYDGPYSTSPLMLSHSYTATKPSSIRSSTNELYIEINGLTVINREPNYGIEITYISIPMTGQPFIEGCGGYVHGDGLITFSPHIFSWKNMSKITDCKWYVESEQDEQTVFLKKVTGEAQNKNQMFFHNLVPTLNVYNGWSLSAELLNNPGYPVLYSTNNKIMVVMKRPKEIQEEISSLKWLIQSSTSPPECKGILDGITGTIKSPNYPAAYPNHLDCRWNIVTPPGTKIRLLFALFDTQKNFDFIFVYDGPTFDSPLLLTKSGSASIPFAVNSSSNQILVRFTSDDEITLPGFLAVYSTV